MPSYNFDVIDGLDWTLDPSQPPRTDPWGHLLDPAASRVSGLRHAGGPVDDEDRFVLATNSYRLARGGGFGVAERARTLLRSPVPTREIVLDHVLASPVDPAPRPRWRFASLPGTAAWFDTGPGAAAHLGRLSDRCVEPMGPAPHGFDRFLLRL